MNGIRTDINTGNSIRLADSLCRAGVNMVFSPLSLNFALGLLAAGAKGKAKRQLDGYLGSSDYGKFAERYLKHAEELNCEVRDEYEDHREVFDIANSLWVNRGRCRLKKAFAEYVSDNYSAVTDEADFGNGAETADKINDWCNERTRGLIPSIIEAGSISEDMAAIMANSVYFESGWMDSWSEGEEKEIFTAENGEKQNTVFMYGNGDAYYENGQAVAFSKVYINGLEFIGILPKKTGAFTFEELCIPELLNSEPLDAAYIDVKMPRITVESETGLKGYLEALGVTGIFDGNAELSGISDDPLYISEILQKARLEADENGTKAAAVTLGFVVAGCVPDFKEKPPREVLLDRPFAFAIYDREEEQIVFMGKFVTTEAFKEIDS
ncbi:MAG: serpin family protein [Eubacteriales bacterium]|nr:serpin family protein [Eubacteriales bacterium]